MLQAVVALWDCKYCMVTFAIGRNQYFCFTIYVLTYCSFWAWSEGNDHRRSVLYYRAILTADGTLFLNWWDKKNNVNRTECILFVHSSFVLFLFKEYTHIPQCVWRSVDNYVNLSLILLIKWSSCFYHYEAYHRLSGPLFLGNSPALVPHLVLRVLRLYISHYTGHFAHVPRDQIHFFKHSWHLFLYTELFRKFPNHDY